MPSERIDLASLGEKLSAPDFGEREVKALLLSRFGIEAELKHLEGERDQNFRVSDGGPQRWVLKISHKDETRVAVDYQVEMLLHLEKTAPDLPVTRGVRDTNGDLYFPHVFENGCAHLVRLVTYLEGTPVAHQNQTNRDWVFDLGVFQSRLCQALSGFSHPGAHEPMPWNCSDDMVLGPKLLAMIPTDLTAALAPNMERLKKHSLPTIQGLRPQVIHNDVHTGNVLMDELGNIAGVIDFGDSVYAPLIQDLAVSAASLVDMYSAEAAGAIAQLTRGFETVLPLSPIERDALPDAIILRAMLSVELGGLKDLAVPSEQRPRPPSQTSQDGLRRLLSLGPNSQNLHT